MSRLIPEEEIRRIARQVRVEHARAVLYTMVDYEGLTSKPYVDSGLKREKVKRAIETLYERSKS